MSSRFSIVIPARYASTRLPGKPLLDIAGKPMIQRVYEQASMVGAEKVVVATDDSRICDVVASFGGQVIMTSANHPSGTDRLQEVAERCKLDGDSIVVNVQGDEPLIPPGVIAQVAQNIESHPEAAVATLSEPIESEDDFRNPNIVKVVIDQNGLALYFSRAPIPWPRDHFQQGKPGLPNGLIPQRHLGIYAYRVNQLNSFVTWPPAPLEKLECLEQLRFLHHGSRIHVQQACEPVPGGVDTPEDLQQVVELIERRR